MKKLWILPAARPVATAIFALAMTTYVPAALAQPAAPKPDATKPAPAAKPAAAAPAANAANAAKTPDAKALLASADKKFKAGDFAGALADYEASNALKPSPEALRGVGLSHDNLGHLVDAVGQLT